MRINKLRIYLLLGLITVLSLVVNQEVDLKIAFTSHHEQTSDIYVMEIGNSELMNLTRNTALNYFPDWSPDGRQIVFQLQQPKPTSNGTGEAGHNQIYVMEADGSYQINLTNDPTGDYYSPTWSPDGKKIAFVTNEHQLYYIGIMNADGSQRIVLTMGINPTWSPDGQRIAFVKRHEDRSEIFVMNVDSSYESPLTDSGEATHFSWFPAWSSDGERIVFVSDRDGNPDIYTMKADGTNVSRLTNSPEREEYPKWSPDGKYLLFTITSADSDGQTWIYMMNADGSRLVKVAKGFAPAWVR